MNTISSEPIQEGWDRNDVYVFHELCGIVARNCPDVYAAAYAMAGQELIMIRKCRAQIPYILSNTRNWRGALAMATKNALRTLESK